MDHDTGTTIKSLKLPAGWRLQWRSDHYWRQVHARQHRDEMTGLLEPAEAGWTPWTGAEPMQGRGGGRWDGTATWWSLVGELFEGTGTEVVLADGHRPPLLQVGGVWACTWISPAQTATVRRGSSEVTFPFYRPSYLPS